jgi:hypothetical protein
MISLVRLASQRNTQRLHIVRQRPKLEFCVCLDLAVARGCAGELEEVCDGGGQGRDGGTRLRRNGGHGQRGGCHGSGEVVTVCGCQIAGQRGDKDYSSKGREIIAGDRVQGGKRDGDGVKLMSIEDLLSFTSP